VTSTVRNKAGFPIRSYCRSCGEDFNGDGYFEDHRVGTHDYLYAEGLDMDPPREDGRRCLDVDEMTARGWRLTERGRWFDPTHAAEVAEAFARSREDAS